MDPKEIVRRGYDQIAERHAEWTQHVRVEEREEYTRLLIDRLPCGAAVLELGCGAGVPTTRRLSEHFAVTGVDIAARQIELARANVPGAFFIQTDMTELALPPAAFDAVTAFYVFGHLSREEHPALLASIAAWLKPSGLLVASFGMAEWPGSVEADWLGVPMYFSSWDAETTRGLVEATGLTIVDASPQTADENGEPVTFLWVVAQKQGL
jgi:SAM-dependent methyltransferase